MLLKDFYDQCADILGTEHHYTTRAMERRTRWNNRDPGNGRFEGYGTIRCFGDLVHINLRSPIKLNAVVEGRQEAIKYLKLKLSEYS